MQHRARKRFGQNFLIDPQVLQDIIAVINPQQNEHLVEIGPGQGALTEMLLALTNRLDIIEIDRDLVQHLEKRFIDAKHLRIYSADALKFDFQTLMTDNKKLRIIGNLPYNISTPLLFRLFNYPNLIADMTFLLQLEVVKRLTAKVGDSNYGRLSVMSQYFCESSYLFSVDASAFNPAPKVTSAMVQLQPRKLDTTAKDLNQFTTVVREAFCQRRKTISNSLKNTINQTKLEQLGIDAKLRPQNLSVADYIRISNAITLE